MTDEPRQIRTASAAWDSLFHRADHESGARLVLKKNTKNCVGRRILRLVVYSERTSFFWFGLAAFLLFEKKTQPGSEREFPVSVW